MTESTADGVSALRASPALFGRPMVYVAIWAIPLLSASLVSPILVHLLPPDEFGQLSAAIALHQVLLVLAVAGLDQALVLARAEAGSDRPARSLIAVGVLPAATITLLACTTAPLWSGPLGFIDGPAVAAVVVAWTLPAGVVALASNLLLSQDRLFAFMAVVVCSGVGGQVVGLTLLVAAHDQRATTYAAGYLAAFTLAGALGLVLTRPRWRGLFDTPVLKRAFALGIPLMFGSLAAFVLNAGDRLVVQRLIGSAEAGRYQIAYIVGEAAVTVLVMTGAAWAPHVASVRDLVARSALLARARDGLVDLLNPAVLGVTLGAPFLLELVAPSNYAPEDLVAVVFLVVVAGYPCLIAQTRSRALVAIARGKAIALSTALAAVTNIGLNIVLVPVWRLEGAAVATVAAYALQALVLQLALRGSPRWPAPSPRLVLMALAVVAVSAATLLLPTTPGWVLARFLAGVACLPWFFLRLRALRAGDLLDQQGPQQVD